MTSACATRRKLVVGCFELFGTERVRTIGDLKGKAVAIPVMASAEHVFLASMMAYVGIDPRYDVNWAAQPFSETARLLAGATIDAYLGLPPRVQELRAKQIGHVIVNSAVNRPMIKSSSQKIIGQGTDWRFLTELYSGLIPLAAS